MGAFNNGALTVLITLNNLYPMKVAKTRNLSLLPVRGISFKAVVGHLEALVLVRSCILILNTFLKPIPCRMGIMGVLRCSTLIGVAMAMSATAIRFDECEKDWIQSYASVLGMSFSEFVRSAALEKVEEAADIKAYNEALMEDDGTRYSMDDVMRMAMEAE